ncbi:MAG: elongation factor P [Gemmatimonadetes bacterium]|nr:elongation factor P [Gemmatimonadota bacterium]
MASTADFRNGLVMRYEGALYQIVYFQHVKPGKGGAFVRTKLKNILTGAVIERTFRAGERIEDVRLERRPLQYLYNSGGIYYFMDLDTFEQHPVSGQIVEGQVRFLKENTVVDALFHEGQILLIELPNFIELEVRDTDPGLRGDTATGGTKPATLETGAVVQVPLFVNRGDRIRVDTRTEQYLERA